MTKEYALVRDVIIQYHPEFQTPQMRKLALRKPEVFNVTFLIEEALAYTSGMYDFINGEHEDFTDGSDSKTASISVNPVKKGSNSYRGEISGVGQIGREVKLKNGALRITMWNPHVNKTEYYYIPKDKWSNLNINFHPSTGKGRIFYTYNKKTNTIPKLAEFKVDSFETLAKLTN